MGERVDLYELLVVVPRRARRSRAWRLIDPWSQVEEFSRAAGRGLRYVRRKGDALEAPLWRLARRLDMEAVEELLKVTFSIDTGIMEAPPEALYQLGVMMSGEPGTH